MVFFIPIKDFFIKYDNHLIIFKEPAYLLLYY